MGICRSTVKKNRITFHFVLVVHSVCIGVSLQFLYKFSYRKIYFLKTFKIFEQASRSFMQNIAYIILKEMPD